MKPKLKPVEEQVIVITGASSGIGRATALAAAERGARVFGIARNERALEQLVEEIEALGGEADYAIADVADAEQMDAAAQAAIERFGQIDTWVNDAGVGLYGRLDEILLEDKRRVFDVNFWGVVHGCRSALPLMKTRGGAIINIGSVESDVAIPLTGIYAASKHAVKAYTDTLRMEFEYDGVPIAVTLIKPAGIDTPFFRHARNYLDVEPQGTPPIYAPEVVADAILHAAEHPMRDIVCGGAGKMMSAMNKRAPRLMDKVMERTQFTAQRTDRPAWQYDDILFRPLDEDGAVDGDYDGHVMQSSAYTKSRLHPLMSTAVLAGVGLAVAAALKSNEAR